MRVDKKRQYLVFGYIHRIKSYNIPLEIINICSLFYCIDSDEWDPQCISDQMKINGNSIVEHTLDWSGGNAFLTQIVECGVRTWTFKLVQNDVTFKELGSIMIGISKVQTNKKPLMNVFFSNNNSGYGFGPQLAVLTDSTGYLRGKKYGTECFNGSIIEMTLDLNHLRLCFKIDGEDYGKALDVDPCKYRACVFMMIKGDQIQLLHT
eukprot:214823_1